MACKAHIVPERGGPAPVFLKQPTADFIPREAYSNSVMMLYGERERMVVSKE
jgi:hypothetical protein